MATPDHIAVMNIVHTMEFQVKQAILNENINDELKQEYLKATYNYVLIQHKLFPWFHEEACTEEDAIVAAQNSWINLMQEMNV